MRRVLAAENLVEQIKLLDHGVDMRMLQPATLSGAMELQITLRLACPLDGLIADMFD